MNDQESYIYIYIHKFIYLEPSLHTGFVVFDLYAQLMQGSSMIFTDSARRSS